MKKLRALKPKDNGLYVFMLNALSRRYLVAAYQAGDPKINLGNAKVDAYESKVAELQSTRVTMIEEDPTEVPELEDYTRVFYIFYRAGQKRQAVDWANERIFGKFDPEGKCAKIPDNDKTRWEAILTRMEQVCKYEDLSRWQRAKADHAVLVDYMFDTPEGLSYAENTDKRPAYDKYTQDLDKALAQVKTIKTNFPDCKTLDRQYGQNGLSLVEMVEKEIDFRRKLRAVRELVMTLALKVANELEQDAATKDAAQKYKEVALAQVKVLGEVLGSTPKMKLMEGQLAFSTGKYEDALGIYEEIRDTVPKESQLYFDARKNISEVYAAQKKWRDAADYPEFIVLTAGLDSKLVRESWPDVRAFLKQCYANGVQPSKEIQKALEEKAGAPPAEGEKKEEEKKEEAQPGAEPKKEEKAPETGPAAGEKKEEKPAGGETKKETPAGAGETKSEEKAAPPAPNPPAATPTAKEEDAKK
jgi:hypothetical protein